jgi:hypothetical protein
MLYSHGITLSVDPLGALARATVGSEPSPACITASNAVEAHFLESRDTIESADSSAWLTACLDTLVAVPLRPRGGVYFVRAESADRLADLRIAVEESGCGTLYALALACDTQTALDTRDSVSSALFADFSDIQREITDWTAKVGDAQRPGRGLKALCAQLDTLKNRAYLFTEVLKGQELVLNAQISEAESEIKRVFEANIK